MVANKAEILKRFRADRGLAHRVLFAHRHKNRSPAFHRHILDAWSCPAGRVGIEAFRGAAKSTIAEEYIIAGAAMREFRNCLIVGETYDRACDRLKAVRHELEHNEDLIELLGPQVGDIWTEARIVTTNNVIIQAAGAGQSLRGIKYLQYRPDLVFCDDIESKEEVSSDKARDDLFAWFMEVLVPLLDPEGRIRMIGTPTHPNCLVERFRKSPAWQFQVFPIVIPHEEGFTIPVASLPGTWEAMWPDRFSPERVCAMATEYAQSGAMQSFLQEYMCRAEDERTKPFLRSHMIPALPTPAWVPAWAMVDPARTTKATSARTGYAVWSWVGSRLIVREAYGRFHKPDEIINEIFRIDAAFRPVYVGVEADGLEEFIFQPLRSAMADRGLSVPIKSIRAPRGKLDFISALQPFFASGEATMEMDRCADLVDEMLSFPTGRMDVVNALAYALRLRPGQPVYEDFSREHVVDASDLHQHVGSTLVVHATPSHVAAVLVVVSGGVMQVKAAWRLERPAMEVLGDVVHEAVQAVGGPVKVAAPADHFTQFSPTGLLAASRKFRVPLDRLPLVGKSSEALVPWLRQRRRGQPAFRVGNDVRWVVGGLAGGYAREARPDGRVGLAPEESPYRLPMEALEAFAAMMARGVEDASRDETLPWTSTADGRTYLSSRPDVVREARPGKGDWR